jgi:hypothetical protein
LLARPRNILATIHDCCFGSPNSYLQFDARSESIDDRYKAIDAETRQVCIPDPREVRSRNAGSRVRRTQRQVFPVKRLNNFGCQDGLELVDIGVFASQIVENIAAPPHHFHFVAFHRNISFSLFKRLFASSISCSCVDFFWKA